MSSDSPAGIPEPTPEIEPAAPEADPAETPAAPESPDPEAPAGSSPGTAGSGEHEADASTDAAAPQDDPDLHRHECRSCGYVYDPGEGVRKLGIGPGTPFRDLNPASFRCPVCRSPVAAFKDIGPRDKPSGFEENLNFGLGVNRLTPGQKNVLIFGGFALAIAFFLSLYSLR